MIFVGFYATANNTTERRREQSASRFVGQKTERNGCIDSKGFDWDQKIIWNKAGEVLGNCIFIYSDWVPLLP